MLTTYMHYELWTTHMHIELHTHTHAQNQKKYFLHTAPLTTPPLQARDAEKWKKCWMLLTPMVWRGTRVTPTLTVALCHLSTTLFLGSPCGEQTKLFFAPQQIFANISPLWCTQDQGLADLAHNPELVSSIFHVFLLPPCRVHPWNLVSFSPPLFHKQHLS